ncbi:phosphopantetheine-binding protein [Rhodobacter sp. TJ_12]|uniref:phosphopantetheine-binding protein n=1 Tax=Rhodobacter sp. TJ_12 TaxID=2029399 RepID=UPI001CBC85D1|nr:phosphopantetheine-binding protein [Rhodobacter sp. TJ_12]
MTLTAHTDPVDRDWLVARVSALLEDEGPIDPTENLIYYGLDSLRVMKLSAELKKHGIAVSFEDLASAPTLEAWEALIAARRGG